ncbi:hypothetical protein [Methylobacterium oryzihabitans]|uniref:Cysteine rich repeat protein n=1 Tax=Methylobacterium oryzihabitans TaxID=2499852 RepID=A0A437PD34_9HYPH|nr:hypothetical protein [Methylobacterium oryzihabitans]RVU20160.1 hypothetical protein EOE48_06000 [Methylobacterium oryzihabitans]
MSRARWAVWATGAGLAALLLPGAEVRAQGTEQERMACMSDAMRLCAADIPSEARIESCLRRNYVRISSACQVVLGPANTTAASLDATGSIRGRR